MLGGMAAMWRWRAKRKAAGKPTDTPNLVCGPVQVVWHKFARYWDVEIREIPMSPGQYCMDVEQMLAQVDENTIMVVPTFGVTYTGAYEPVLELAEALDKLAEDTGLDIDIHVDGAVRRLPRPVLRPRRGVGLPHPAGQVDLAPPGTSSGWPRSGSAGCCGGTRTSCPTTSSSTSPTSAATCPSSRSTSPGRPARSWPSTTTSSASAVRATRPSTTPATRRPSSWPSEIVKLGPFELLCDGNPLTGIPSVAWRIKEGEDPGLHPLRRGRPPAGEGLAGAGLPADRLGVRHLGPADPGAPGREPRPGLPAARRHRGRPSSTSTSTR